MADSRRILAAWFLVFIAAVVVAAQAPKITPKETLKPSAKTPVRPVPREPKPSKEGVDFFEKQIRPVLVRSCYKCHSGDPAKAKGGFVLDTHDGLRKGGDSGAVIEPKHPEKSLLIEALNYEGLEMPPGGKLPDEVIADFTKWVEMGAPDPRVGKAANPKNRVDLAEARKYWAFQKPKASPAPKVQETSWPISDIDRFVLARLDKEKLQPNHDTDPATLIRRVTFDLTGLPPKPEEIDAFVNDKSVNALATVVDKLLASPQYGERWGRHWLDVVRYAESSGKERNLPYRYAWRYRDYVIDSFNEDKPYDKFIVEQLAGDLIQTRNAAEHDKLTIATGFLAIGPQAVNTRNPEQFKVDLVDDQIDVTGRAFLGMTIACARCHDHKFDPIPTTDYYAFAGIFHSTETFSGMVAGRKTAADKNLLTLKGNDKREKESPTVSNEEKERQQEIAKLESDLEALRKMKGPGAGGKKAQNQKGNGAKGQGKASPVMTSTGMVDPKDKRDQIKKIQDRLDELEKQPTTPGNYVMGVRDADSPADFHVLNRGELKDKGPDVPRGVLTVLKSPQTSHFNPSHSGRMEMAHWIADRSNPLTARVMVNRIWEHIFGDGLVDTVDNFGALGNEPSNPELLDYLAVKFMDQNWSVKKLIRMIVLSRVYHLSSEHSDENYEKDADNKFLWRMERRRLDAEEIRDAMLMASGQIDLERPNGSPVMQLSNAPVGGGKGMQDVRKPSTVRSVYLPILRGIVPEMLGVFDMADPNLIVGKRDVTTVPTQALFLLNNPFVLKQSEEMAKRILATEKLDLNDRIELAYKLALGRSPNSHERSEVSRYLSEYRTALEKSNPKGNVNVAAWASICQTLFQTALFRYLY